MRDKPSELTRNANYIHNFACQFDGTKNDIHMGYGKILSTSTRILACMILACSHGKGGVTGLEIQICDSGMVLKLAQEVNRC